MQVKLLRVIQEKTIRPVGDNTERPVDVRILSATHRNLGELVEHGTFREDLYYRINVIELAVPSLRERGEDILLLARSILSRAAGGDAGAAPRMTAAAQAALLAYHFPGNVRELENILERAQTLCSDGLIDVDDVQLRHSSERESGSALRPAPGPAAAATATTATGGSLGTQLEDIERDAIVKALEKTRYNKTKAAQVLGISFRALRYRIKKLGIE
jgi:two-component system response regulator PilR (NtrC family)